MLISHQFSLIIKFGNTIRQKNKSAFVFESLIQFFEQVNEVDLVSFYF